MYLCLELLELFLFLSSILLNLFLGFGLGVSYSLRPI
jgi:hypothetical protein